MNHLWWRFLAALRPVVSSLQVDEYVQAHHLVLPEGQAWSGEWRPCNGYWLLVDVQAVSLPGFRVSA